MMRYIVSPTIMLVLGTGLYKSGWLDSVDAVNYEWMVFILMFSAAAWTALSVLSAHEWTMDVIMYHRLDDITRMQQDFRNIHMATRFIVAGLLSLSVGLLLNGLSSGIMHVGTVSPFVMVCIGLAVASEMIYHAAGRDLNTVCHQRARELLQS